MNYCTSRPIAGVILVLACAAIAQAQAPKKDAEFPPELVKFVPLKKNPIFVSAGKGKWDELIRERGWILREGQQWKMWYTGYLRDRSKKLALGYATSRDGIHWQRHPRNPLYTKHWVEDMIVLKHKGKYVMFAEGDKDRARMTWKKTPGRAF